MDSWLRDAGRGIASAGKIMHGSLDSFGQNAGNALDSWGKHVGKDLDPSHPLHIAMTKTGEFSFGAAGGLVCSLDGLGQQTEKSVSEAYNQAHQHISEVDWENLPQKVRERIEHIAKELGITVSAAAAEDVFRIVKSHLPEEIQQWIEEHPEQTTFFGIAGFIFFVPFLIRVPVLSSLGFATNGVAAGSAAAAIQSIIGPGKAGSIFSLLQSAAAGGSGLAVVNGTIATSAGVGIGAAAATCAD